VDKKIKRQKAKIKRQKDIGKGLRENSAHSLLPFDICLLPFDFSDSVPVLPGLL
jgi:hypothetical protein